MAELAIAGIGAAVGAELGWYAASQFAITVGEMAVISAVGSYATQAALKELLISDGGGTALYGQQISTTKSQVSTYGKAIPIVFGSIRLAGNIIWAAPLQEHASTQSSDGGGGKGKKGGGGGGGDSYTSYTYSASFAASVCKGPIAGIRKIWANNELIYNLGDTASIEEIIASNAIAVGLKFYLGNETQLPDPAMESYLGSGNVPAYRGQAYAVFSDAPLERFGNRLPNLEFEVVSVGNATTSLVEHYNVAGVTHAYFTCPTYCDDHALHFIECTGTQWKDWSLPHGQAVATLVDVKSITASDSIYYYPTPNGYCDEIGKFMMHNSYSELWYHGYAQGEFTDRIIATAAVSISSACKRGTDYLYSGIATPSLNMRVGLNGINLATLPQNIGLSTGNATCGITDNYLYAYHPQQHYIHRFDRSGIYIDAVTDTAWWNGEWIIKFASDGIAYAANATGSFYRLDFTNPSSVVKTFLFTATALTSGSLSNSIPQLFGLANDSGYVGGIARYPNITNSAIFTQNKLGKDEVSLGSVITSLSSAVGVEPSQLDVLPLTDTVTGYAVVNQMAARTAIEQLLSYTSVGAIESEGKIKFHKRSVA